MKQQVEQVIWTQISVAEIQPGDLPTPKDDEVLVRTRLTLISPGTERSHFLGAAGTAATFPRPAFGYNNVGEIVELGRAVTGWKIGERVACAAGHVSYYVRPVAVCLRVPETVADDAAVFCNLIMIALQGVRKARIELGESVLVIGAGLVGLLAMQLAKLQGGLPVAVVDQDAGRAAFARQLGSDPVEAIEQPAVVIEATGAPPAVNRAFELAGQFARVILLGSTRGEVNELNIYQDVHRKGLTVIGAHNMARPQQDCAPGWWTLAEDGRTALRLLAARRLCTDALITHRFAAAAAPRAYKLLANGDLTGQGMVLEWP